MAFTDKGCQLYAEAFPHIDIVVAERHFKRGEHVCQWFNEHKFVVGAISIEALDAETLRFHHIFYGTINVEKSSGETTIELIRKDRGAYIGRPLMICPECAGEREKMFFVDRLWKCHICHDLTSVKKLFNSTTHWGRRVLFLDTEISLGKPKNMQAKTFQNKIDELAAIEARRVPNSWQFDHYYLQVPQWLGGNDIPAFQTPEEHWGYNWKPNEEFGFLRLNWRRHHERWHPSEIARKERRLKQEQEKRRKVRASPDAVQPNEAGQKGKAISVSVWFGDNMNDDLE